MYRVEKTFRVPVGHRLSKHAGLCKNIHGHNLKIKVSLSTTETDSNDMVVDFSDIKAIVNPILAEFDHACLFNPTDETVKKLEGFKLVSITDTDTDPTAEVFCKYLYDRIDAKVSLYGIKLDYVRIWESDDSMAEYTFTNPE